ncbi:MAG: Aldehyde ferredoxin oxidoreductase [Candidatus Falkowbacteria bacterium GW2011_GWC2_38_22]|uniref:Aldehyde ferredoxin oxidoreductase n=1 Tax=Candidatus Falkowbacteria bacterium GW2011_GWE1_38_31 TaxID=1618638 RepID=A0A0G0JSZ0_9BACT|nr:MAG: Aldehyde ferredoxin oxidoreductase [Candidatus Falkowbacteria bacterium GW2011_GWF2_38_1205]KKQ61665.1 MAG: Aldehyde ferredoxin oxidoreductase [Candidatus Falkowbacteria bacterium GW2011_GWC2_38_22]KKQ63720.1 MAG: Aldehyde ferredoxin oxidoreductase [Candidatus Falkowbacteria bacterium GW2011_GWF1_38_22]KKQ65864.1 MAG: Aldehyde ferredoxin oxidoreductase [Candidatus Falkowbacteria bacterium GW2011_GWE2_38_254]KKQ70583.1 MAG: Aldehyde ferredoxin oxidoreductase [Candidatus Falkowbacteria ba
MDGYQRIAINLCSGNIKRTDVDLKNTSVEERLGGVSRGINAVGQQLFNHSDLDDAYDTRSMLSFDLGFITGSSVISARRVFLSGLSPLKTSRSGSNGIYYSAASGDFGPYLKSTGIDSLLITGKANEPMFLEIGEDGVRILPAKGLIGKTTKDKIRVLSEIYQNAAFAVIGTAGENKVRFANVAISTSDDIKGKSGHMRFLGRGGFGAVLGSKNLLGIVVKRGGGKHKLDAKAINKEIVASPKSKKYTEKGTFASNIEGLPLLGLGLFDNFTKSNTPLYRERVEKLYSEKVAEDGLTVKTKGCTGCTIKCWKEVCEKENILGKIDYEPGALLGPNIGIFDLRQIMQLITIGDEMGMDTISLGGAIAFAMERDNRFGDFAYAYSLAKKIGEGKDTLSEGVMRVSGYDHSYALHVKGLELPGYLGNVNPGYAFAVAGLHMSMDTYNRAWYPDAENSLEEWAENCKRGSNIILYDLIGLCKFAKPSLGAIAGLYEQVYGEINEEELFQAARRVYLSARLIDERLGFTADDDVLPLRCHRNIGSNIPHFNTLEFFLELKKHVYKEMKKEIESLNLTDPKERLCTKKMVA